MANFNFNVSESEFNVTLVSSTETDCATIYRYQVTTTGGNSVTFTLNDPNGYADNMFYQTLGVETAWSGAALELAYGTDLYISFSLGNSGVSGFFNKAELVVVDNTTVEDYDTFTDIVTRENDSAICDEVKDLTYDQLVDTPSSKIGSALKLIRVNAAGDAHEYIDAGLLGVDLNYAHTQGVSNNLWTVNHSLGKYPSVSAFDISGNEIEGVVTHTNINNLTITFNSPFEGMAYLN